MTHAFDPVSIAGLQLKNRLVRSATAERLALRCNEDVEALSAIYRRLAEGGVGLIVTGHIAVDPSGRVNALQPTLCSDEDGERWRRVAEAAHKAGAVLCAQISHAGGRARLEDVDKGGLFDQPVCVSPLPHRDKDPLDGRYLAGSDIERLIEAFAQAAARAKEAGMDAVQIHGAHGYLGSQFLSPLSNKRADMWGASLGGRARFLRRVIQSVRQAVGPDFPIGVKLGVFDDEESEGLTIGESTQAAQWFETDGLDFVEVSAAFRSDICRRNVRPGKGEAYYLDEARRLKKALTIPVIAVGGFRSLEVMNRALETDGCDAVAMCRPLIRQPDLPNLMRDGVVTECASCNLCLFTQDAATACHKRERDKRRKAAR